MHLREARVQCFHKRFCTEILTIGGTGSSDREPLRVSTAALQRRPMPTGTSRGHLPREAGSDEGSSGRCMGPDTPTGGLHFSNLADSRGNYPLTLSKMHSTTCLLSETLRLKPHTIPAFILERSTRSDDTSVRIFRDLAYTVSVLGCDCTEKRGEVKHL